MVSSSMRTVIFVVVAVMVSRSASAAPRTIEVVDAGVPVRGALAHVVHGPDGSSVVPVDGGVHVDPGDREISVVTRDGFAVVAAPFDRIELGRECQRVAIETVDAAKRGRPMQVRLRVLGSTTVYAARTGPRGRGEVCLPADEYATEIDTPDATSLLQVARPGSGQTVRLVAVARARVSARSLDRGALRRAARPLDAAAVLAALPATARLVALGEPTHGTVEPVVLRGEVARAAMERAPVLVIAQMPAGDAVAIDRYLRGIDAELVEPEPDPASWKWSSREVIEQVRLLRAENLRRGGARLRLVGVDPMQAAPTYRQLVRAAAGDAALAAQVAQLAALGAENRARRAVRDEREREALRAGLRALTTAGGASAEVKALAGALVDYVELRSAPAGTVTERREELMATRTAELVEAHRGAAFLWARNIQIAREPYGDVISLGQRLARRLGASYVAVGSFTGGGQVLAWATDVRDGIVAHPLPTADADMFEHALGAVAPGAIVVDLIRNQGARRALRAAPRWVREVGLSWISDRDTRILRNLGAGFDLLVFVPVSRALTLTGGPARAP
jgi:erythromycin esterase-like protein